MITVTAKPSSTLRCAVCHDTDVIGLHRCQCGSQFHGECGPCPTLGCVPPLQIRMARPGEYTINVRQPLLTRALHWILQMSLSILLPFLD